MTELSQELRPMRHNVMFTLFTARAKKYYCTKTTPNVDFVFCYSPAIDKWSSFDYLAMFQFITSWQTQTWSTKSVMRRFVLFSSFQILNWQQCWRVRSFTSCVVKVWMVSGDKKWQKDVFFYEFFLSLKCFYSKFVTSPPLLISALFNNGFKSRMYCITSVNTHKLLMPVDSSVLEKYKKIKEAGG